MWNIIKLKENRMTTVDDECQFCGGALNQYEQNESPNTAYHPTCEHCWNQIESHGKDPEELKLTNLKHRSKG